MQDECPQSQKPSWNQLKGDRNAERDGRRDIDVLIDAIIDPETNQGPNLIRDVEISSQSAKIDYRLPSDHSQAHPVSCPRMAGGATSAIYEGIIPVRAPTPNPVMTLPAYIIGKLDVVAVMMAAPTKKIALVICMARTRPNDSLAGHANMEPKNPAAK